MKKLVTIIFSFTFGLTVLGQVGINTTTPDPSAMLDITSTDKGILVPRMTEAQKNSISSPATGLLVYQTDGSNPGFYFYDGSQWNYLAANAASSINELSDGITDATGSSTFLGLNTGASDDGTANWNTALGRDAFTTNTSGSFNTALGAQSLENNTTGQYNTAVGNSALRNNTTAQSNTAVGYQSLRENTTGTNNTALGISSLLNNTTGSYNLALGVASLATNTTGTNSTGIGYSALYANTTGNYNVAVGNNSLRQNTTGANNIAVGSQSLYSNSTGNYNTAQGHQSLYTNETGLGNTATGYMSLYSNYSGDYNTAAGYQALSNTTSGDHNVSIGAFSLNSNTFGSQNTAVGYAALNSSNVMGNSAFGYSSLSNSTGSNNSAFGTRSLLNNTSGSDNSGFGDDVLFDNTTGSYNTAMGSSNLPNNTTGANNNGFGYRTMNLNTTGSFNSAIGNFALERLDSGNNNIAIGYDAGRFVDSNSSNNVFIGYQAGRGSSSHTISGSVLLGYQAGYYETNDNRLYIENSNANASNALLYGEFDNDILRTNGEFQIGNPATTGYALPTADGNVGEVLTTDGAGQLSFTTPASVQNTLDDAYDEGGAGVGRTINVDTGSLEFLGSGSTTYTNVISHLSAGNAMQINTSGNMTTASTVSQGIEVNNSVNTNASFTRNYGIFNKLTVNGTAVNGISYGSRTWFLPAGAADGTLYGFHVENQNGGNSDQFGLYSRISNSGNGEKNGVYSYIEGSGTGDKYGIQSIVSSSAGGTHYGIYAAATQPSGYAGFFVGRASFGTDYSTGRYLLPAADGTAGQVMTTDGAGQLSWQDASENLVSFRATASAFQNLAGNSTAILQFDTETFDLQNNYDPTTYTFTAPSDGLYRINAVLRTSSNTANVFFVVRINGVDYVESNDNSPFVIFDTLAELNTSDTITIHMTTTTSASAGVFSSTYTNHSYFEIVKYK